MTALSKKLKISSERITHHCSVYTYDYRDAGAEGKFKEISNAYEVSSILLLLMFLSLFHDCAVTLKSLKHVSL